MPPRICKEETLNRFQPMPSAYMPIRQAYRPYRQPYRQMPPCRPSTKSATMCVYLSNRLRGLDLEVVLAHEVGHCAMYSYGLLDSLHAAIPEDTWVDVEEWVCNYLANRGA